MLATIFKLDAPWRNSLSFSKRDLELAWAAGLFDGEGSTYVRQDCNARNAAGEPKTSASLCIDVAQVNSLVLRRFCLAVGGLGNIYHTKPRIRRPLGCHHWRLVGLSNVQFVLGMLWSNLSLQKKAQAIQAVETYVALPRMKPIRFFPISIPAGHKVEEFVVCQ